MTVPPLDPDAIDRLRHRTGAPTPTAEASEIRGPNDVVTRGGEVDEAPAAVPGWFEGDDWSERVRSFRTRLLAPAEQRVRREVRAAVARHDSDLSRQVTELRSELIRTRTEHAAEIAALQEQLRNRH